MLENKIIKKIKIGGIEYRNLRVYEGESYNIPIDLEEFRTVAIDTMNWSISKIILGDEKIVGLLVSLSKAIVLQGKGLKDLGINIDEYTPTEKSITNSIDELYESGYADSSLLDSKLTSIKNTVPEYTDRIIRIMSLDTIDNIIDVLNEQ